MWRVSHVIKFLVIVQFCQYSFRMLLLNCFYVRNITKIQLMNDMTDIKSLDFLIDHQPCKNILIRMWTYMKVTRYLFDSKWSHQSASIIILKCCFCHFKLFPLVRLPQQLKIVTVQSLSIWIQSVFLYWTFFHIKIVPIFPWCDNMMSWRSKAMISHGNRGNSMSMLILCFIMKSTSFNF